MFEHKHIDMEESDKTHPKSVAINVASTTTFSFSIFSYTHPQYFMHLSLLVVLSLIIAYFVPPVGWLAPSKVADRRKVRKQE